MKIVDAFWEKRNIGVDAIELTIEETDSVEEIQTILRNVKSQYIVVRVPVARIDLYYSLHEYGFIFAETILQVSYDVKNIRYYSDVICRLSKKLEYRKTDDCTRIFHNIEKGMFTTDRIYLDPYFSNEQAANRYVFWMKDEYERQSDFYEFLYKDNAIGFICLRKITKESYYPVLGGLYVQDKPAPFGVALLYRQLDVVASKGGEYLITNISANNLPVIKAYSLCGYTISEANYVFVRHQ